MSASLTDRYVHAVTRQLPTDQRAEIELELRSTLADMAEASSEHDALVQLGDPAVLAANYRWGGRVLIGAALYPDYIRQLRLWLTIVVPIVAAVATLGAALADDVTVGSIITSVLGGAATAALQVCFWVTLVFAAIERFGPDGLTDTSEAWQPEDLPDVPAEPQVGLGDTAAEVVLTIVLIAVLFAQRSWSPIEGADGESVPVLDPDLWSGPAWLVIGLLLAGLAFAVAAHLRGRWSWPLAIATTAVDLALLALVAWAAFGERLVNPDFLVAMSDELGRDTTLQPNPLLITIVVAAVLLWDAGETLRAAFRAERRS
jgi:hypothetical protein